MKKIIAKQVNDSCCETVETTASEPKGDGYSFKKVSLKNKEFWDTIHKNDLQTNTKHSDDVQVIVYGADSTTLATLQDIAGPAERVPVTDSINDAGFKNKKATSVMQILKGIPGMTDDKARALLMYHGGLTALNKITSVKDLLRFKALKEVFTESQAQTVIKHLEDRRRKSKEYKKIVAKK